MSIQPKPDNPESTTSLERKAVALLTGVAIILVGFALYVMFARGVFERTQELVLLSDDSEGVIVGMDMTFSGFPIGRVRRIELADDGKVRIVMEVPNKDSRWLRTSSIFTLERGMVGDTRIRAFSGILTDPPLPANAERTLLRGDMAAEIPRLMASVRALLDNLETMTGSESSLNTSLAHLMVVTERLTSRYGMLTGVLGNEDNARKLISTLDSSNTLLKNADSRLFGKGGVADDAQNTLKSTQATLADSQKAIAQLTALLSDTRNTLGKVDAVLVEAQAVGANVRSASTDLGQLRTEVEVNLRKISQLTDEVNRKWPFARDVEIKLP
ncbi:MAG: MCE family protein [Rhodoferax sp.]|uniref:MlaD family protein n=1 Tax=Rhodoferax sp. TaxID=50421 RepID=UPI001B60AC1C|nr:MlaD family protein [Rhodoferax sp.]MBP9907272.1 MCE family protein [Rhodoferax sp.]